MVQEIEKFSPELKFLALGHPNILEGGEIPIAVARALGYVSACCTELLDRRIGILGDLLKCTAVKPCAGGVRSGVGILPEDQVRAVREESGDLRRRALYRKVRGVENGEYILKRVF